ncbi:SpoIID/LytB domain-containing protein [bacterium]|nr:SpoIID/LytB domain-containing protein [bacterium]
MLLDRSNAALSVRILEPAAVRVNGKRRSPELQPGVLWLHPSETGELEIVRIPYVPLIVGDLDLQWSKGKIGFETADRKYRGGLRVQVREGEVFLVNNIAMEHYLASTVGGEMSPSWPLEALKAQTVAARSYTVAKIRQPRHALFDLEDTTEDQVYQGVGSEQLSVWDAVKQTDGVVLTRLGRPTTAYYHSRCGGETLTPEQAWGKRRLFAERVPCPYCRNHPFQWDGNGTIKLSQRNWAFPRVRTSMCTPSHATQPGVFWKSKFLLLENRGFCRRKTCGVNWDIHSSRAPILNSTLRTVASAPRVWVPGMVWACANGAPST